MNWAWIDIAMVAVVVISSLVGFTRGFVREAMSLASWVLASMVAMAFSHRLAGYFESWLAAPSARIALGFAILFAVTLFLGGILTNLICRLIQIAGLSGTDRSLGGAFGLVRGVLIVVVLVTLAGLTPMPQDPWWRESALIPHVQPLATWIAGFLPESVASYFVYS
ncbi:MAG: CvpA family protein [Gammaproteobacteria bacterium]|nr:CvpA family protein [Gammaproteobacteria bacterium]MCP5137468.1 CvpA family protein [Gammaproteobacteria bacterium]